MGTALGGGCMEPRTPSAAREFVGFEVSVPDVPATEPEPEPPLLGYAEPRKPGFVLYTLGQSIVVPSDGSPPVVAPGLWLQDDRTSPPTRLHHSLVLEDLELPPCPCAEIEGACELNTILTTRFDDIGNVVRSPDVCRCWFRPEFAMTPPAPEDTADGVAYGPCSGSGDSRYVSLVGGQLHELGWDANGACFGSLNTYDAYGTSYPLIDDPPNLDNGGMGTPKCVDPESVGPALIAAVWPLPRAEDQSHCEYGTFAREEAETFLLRRGFLWWVGDNMLHAGADRWFSRRRVRPGSCPGLGDPCGSPRPFTAKKDFRRWREFWIATDGTAALTGTRERYALWHANADAPTPFELPGVHATTDVIGVRAHDDVGPLLRLVEHHDTVGEPPDGPGPLPSDCGMPAAFPTDADFTDDTGRGWSNRCFAHLKDARWTAAEAACRRGLETARDPNLRGALLYNLGRVAEGREAFPYALELYRASLTERPENRIVKRRLRTLERRLDAHR